MKETTEIMGNQWRAACVVLVLVLSVGYGTYGRDLGEPRAFFWDESYHIASAQKYLHGIHFMESHPPLGKMLIALGRKLEGSGRNAHFIDTDQATWTPRVFDFTPYRRLPATLAWLTSGLLFGVFLLIARRVLAAAVLSSLYLFDNALIVHQRGAMLEGPLLFFAALSILAFLLVLEWRGSPRRTAAAAGLLGAALGLALATKLLGLILILLVPAACWWLWPDWKVGMQVLAFAAVGCLITFGGVWTLHFELATKINKNLPDQGFYGASPTQHKILEEGRGGTLAALPIQLRDAWRFSFAHQEGVPKLDLGNPNESGSPFFYWPLGARAINYRWEKESADHHRYLYLQANPVAWGLALLGLVLATGLRVATWLSSSKRPLQRPVLLNTFLLIYFAYMVAVSQIDRVMYLYHYFLPLLISFILLALVGGEIRQLGVMKLTNRRWNMVWTGIFGAIVLGFLIYRPLTYYSPLSRSEVERRALLPLWDLRCADCPLESSPESPRR